MNITAILHSVAYVPLLSARPFLTAFVISLTPWLGLPIADLPGWFTALITQIFLGGLAGIEILANKDPDLRMLLGQIDGFIKAGVGLGVTFSLVDGQSAALVGTLLGGGVDSPSLLTMISSGLSFIWSTMMAIGTWISAWMRQSFYNFLAELDEDDDLGLQEALSWLEDLGVLGGIILAAIIPLVALILFGLTILTLFALEKFFAYREKKRQIVCAYCETGMHASALLCPHCRQQNPQPRQVGLFGQSTKRPATDLAKHQQQLVARKRCPTCATKFEEKAIRQTCVACGTTTFSNAAAVDAYLQPLRGKLPQTALITFGLSFIPFLGIIPAVIYYRFSLIASLRGYIPRTTGCLVRWGVRLFNLILIALQPIPILGAVMLPLMALSNYFIYQAILTRERDRVFGTKRSQPPSGPVGPPVAEGQLG